MSSQLCVTLHTYTIYLSLFTQTAETKLPEPFSWIPLYLPYNHRWQPWYIFDSKFRINCSLFPFWLPVKLANPLTMAYLPPQCTLSNFNKVQTKPFFLLFLVFFFSRKIVDPYGENTFSVKAPVLRINTLWQEWILECTQKEPFVWHQQYYNTLIHIH